jgi:membrane protease YdiL (CAAX protease family)
MKIFFDRDQLSVGIHFIILVSFPLILWIIPNQSFNMAGFLLLGILYIFSKYLGWLQKLYPILEILFLFLAVNRLLEILGLSIIFPVNHLITLILLYGFVLKIRKVNRSTLFIHFGLVSSNIWLATIFTVLSLIGLAWWFRELAANPYARFIPDLPIHFLLPLGIGFALINSLYEEGIFRSIFLGYLDQLFHSRIALLLQALWFSFLHYQSGFPAGIIGMMMTFIFGLMMGILVRRTQGLLLAIVIHAIADFWIFLLIVMRIHGKF